MAARRNTDALHHHGSGPRPDPGYPYLRAGDSRLPGQREEAEPRGCLCAHEYWHRPKHHATSGRDQRRARDDPEELVQMNPKKHKPRAAKTKVTPIPLAPEPEPPDDPRERALDLVDRALETGNAAEVRKLMRQAVKLDPDCVDALLMLAKVTRLSASQYLGKMREAVRAGERTLGPEFFKANRGHFWLMIETRPYMRARFDLGMALGNNGDIAGAIAEFEGMLDLNPRDNQGVRDYLLALYLALQNLDGAARLLRDYGDF